MPTPWLKPVLPCVMAANAANKQSMTTVNALSYALITGASTGIGCSLAHCFARRGIPLILSASPRSEQALADLAAQLQAQYGVAALQHCVDLGQAGAAELQAAGLSEKNVADLSAKRNTRDPRALSDELGSEGRCVFSWLDD